MVVIEEILQISTFLFCFSHKMAYILQRLFTSTGADVETQI